jgi:hypothetical protein
MIIHLPKFTKHPQIDVQQRKKYPCEDPALAFAPFNETSGAVP